MNFFFGPENQQHLSRRLTIQIAKIKSQRRNVKDTAFKARQSASVCLYPSIVKRSMKTK